MEEFLQIRASELGPRWAGAWLGPDGKTINIGLTDGPVPESLKSRPDINVVTMRYGSPQLRRAIEAVTLRLNALLADGWVVTGAATWPYMAVVNTQANTVDIEIDPSQKGKRPLIDQALADLIDSQQARILGYKTVAQNKICGSRSNCSPPFRGGIQVDSSTGYHCTLGFVMRNSTGIRFMSTASHCPGSPWSHAGRSIGYTVWTLDSGNVDFKIIREDNQAEPVPTNWIYRGGNAAQPITTKIWNPNDSTLIGNTLCTEGYQGGEVCGSLASATGVWEGRCCFGVINSYACFGDSGSPVINYYTNRAYGIALGKLGTGDCSGPVFFTHIANAEAASGYSLLMTATTDALGPGQRLNADMQIVSQNGAYRLVMQGDGNLVIYQSSGAVWATNTNGNPGAWAVMQNDGNLVVYRSNGTAAWASNTNGNSGAYLIMQNDRNLVIYRATGGAAWASGTNA